ncbi:MAG: hydantoinase B/oxoprolinase family protein, partial [Candidatus Sericytochromatia bacterium]|nr:hydantoinase B/oxoprolinase family protein [Candidatus Tanganyikabacteria bacterium]
SLAICLLHATANPAHERIVADLAREAGFLEISASSEVSAHEKIVSRADTTVLDAYLNPVLRRYVQGIAGALGPRVRLEAMTSAGGLVPASAFRGRDCLLSGPAGGVVGFSEAARLAGFSRAIGFDMGGTSTDVSRWGGELETEFEAEKAGVRVVAPMLAIETVAAGGGSVCRFDGIKLVVGPESAGADPGPACYGRGGPLTVTDLNLVLGRLDAARFPFPLDAAAPMARLADLFEEIDAAPGGRRYAPLELAAGFLAIANANMVHAIRRVSTARGYDPADHVLVAFGGAAGQHACAVARELGMRRILFPPLAGILSAAGIGQATQRRIATAAVNAPCTPAALAALEATFSDLEARTAADLAAAGIRPGRIGKPARSLALRYQGVDRPIDVPAPAAGATWEAEYARCHERLYGYGHPGRSLEIVAARVERAEVRSGTASGVPRADLCIGDTIDGPAIVADAHATLVVDPGWTGVVTEHYGILLTDAQYSATPATSDTAADPVRLEIFNNHFAAIADQMGTVLRRTAGSTNVKERLDFSCALFTRDGALVVNAPHIPVHLGAMGETVRQIIRDNPDMREGDAYCTNDPYRGGSHLPDITVATPVYIEHQLRFFVASRAHHADVGGSVPGSMPPFSRNLAEEGCVIRNFKLLAAGAPREEALADLLRAAGARDVAGNLADLRAQLAANQVGIEALRDLVARRSLDVVTAYMGHIQAAAAAKVRKALASLEPGTRHFADHLDDGTPIRVALTVGGDRAIVDFAGTGPVRPGNLNATRAIVTAAVLYVFRCLIAEDIPLNQGVLDPLEIRIPAGTLLSGRDAQDPAACAAVAGGNVETSQRLVDVLLGALRGAAASQGTMNNLTFGNADFGYYETICGGAGATPDADGADAVHSHMTNTRLTDPEVLERRYPVRLWRFAIRRGSGGAGRHRGGDGAVREVEFLAPVDVAILSERRGPYPPYGLEGGLPGSLGRNLLVRRGAAAPEDLGGKAALSAAAGDRLIVETPGGGGYGPG